MINSDMIWNELSSPIRSKILVQLLDIPLKLNEIAESFSVSKSEISRHLSRLLEIKLITKEPSTNHYLLTPLGEAYVSLSFPINFILDHNNFFQNHYIDLPSNLYRMIDNLQDSDQIEGTGNVLTSIQDILENTEKKVQLVLDQKFPLTLKKRINRGSYIISENMVERGLEYAKNVYDSVEVRICDTINHNMLISDNKIGIICFPGLNHKADINFCFRISDEMGLRYLQDIWEYYTLSSDLKKI